MKQILAFESLEEYSFYQNDIKQLNLKWENYKDLLMRNFKLIEVPKTIVWTTSENATTVFSKLPVPAFTKKDTIFMSPSVQEWRKFYLSQLTDEDLSDKVHVQEIKDYFNSITIDHVFCILAHELTHHIELFPDEFESESFESIWFEEGMCEYLSQKFTLTDQQLGDLRAIEHKMIQLFKGKYGQFPLDNFGSGSYENSPLAAIMLNYWRSSSAITYLVEERYNGDVMKVFNLYHEWDETGRKLPLTEFFEVSDF